MNNAQLPLWQTQQIVQNGIVIGFIKVWNASGLTGGLFSYQNTSANAPHNTMSDWIRIR